MGRRVVSGGCHPVERKNDDFTALRLSDDCHPTERSWMEVGHMSQSFILKSTQQEEALHHIQ
ncbi:unnamed protein product [Spirodela intermedia]|uniref:Uncharacterized protein n=1 Tax=Spirodela intermedia TaxID=51605 RepID=A0A7I8JZZ8_SPIIN|nr:unnamed protein product [Spirodela intermedia]